MACHTPPLKKSEETRGNAIIQPRSHPIILKKFEFRDGMGPRLGSGISLCFFTFFILKSFLFYGENFLLLVCKLFRVHEVRSQLR